MSDDNMVLLPGIGLDCGTMNFVAARYTQKDEGKLILTSRMRDAFIELPLEAKKHLKLASVNFVQVDDQLVVVGDKAMEYANVGLFGGELRRPLKAGLISAGESDAIKILGILIKHCLKTPQREGEYCYFSVPAEPVDVDRKVIYHKGILENIIKECGFTPIASNEAMAIIYSETAEDDFDGIGISFGSGMTNVALSVGALEGLSFSVGRGGDWIDEHSAASIDSTAARICALKEAGIDLMNPKGREQETLAIHYKHHIEYVLDLFVKQFVQIKDKFAIPRAIPIVVSGGTSKAGGFLEFFKATFESKRRKFPLEIKEIRAASDPLNAVAQGLLVQAALEYDED